jgi:outer membrane protein TolC
MSISLPQADDTDWQVALQLSFPLYSGGEKQARLRREHFSLQALRLRRQAVSEQIRERIRLALFEAQKSYPAIRLSQEAARAAEKNLELVSDAYSRGVVSIIELLDAQNAALVAREVAANAVHDFLADLMQVNRAVGSFSLFLGPPARDRWFERVERFFRARLGKQGF